jgi:NAD(P)-dependent dehydrogenase (short-subunit alcohol dehydrogenase family)
VRALIIGASRGLGLEFVRQFRSDGAVVTATARDAEGLARLEALGAKAMSLDVADVASASGLAWLVDGEAFDVVVYNAAAYGPRHSGLDAPTEAEFDAVMHTNVLGAMRVLPQLVGVLAPGAKLAVLSSRMGSIGEREAAFGWLYRASKAALNSVLKDASLVLNGHAICVALHPGWVKTDMGGAGADLTPERSVSDLRQVIAKLSASDNGKFFNHDGSMILW